jgi:ribonuclease P protein component
MGTTIGRLTRAADFERLLGAPVRRRSAHFSVHHVSGSPSGPHRARLQAPAEKLSTSSEPSCPESVDESPLRCWLGCILPKRHARRAVTRNSLERQIHAAAQRHESEMPCGLWLVRLHRPFAVGEYPSADSQALRTSARAELERLFAPRERDAPADARVNTQP